jgi:PAS domain S-box-containing protein
VDSTNIARLPTIPSLSWDDCRLLVDSVVDYAIFMLDVDGRVATWNLGAEKIKGYGADEIIGEHFSKFYPPEDVAAKKPERELEIAKRDGRVEDEGWRIRKNGSRFWASVVITALRDASGMLRGYGKVTRDLTSRRAAEQELWRAEQRFHHLVDAVIDYAIFMLDEAGRVATWNSGARRVKGYAAEEILGQHFSVFYEPEDRAAGKPERILETVRREGRFEDEGFRVRKDGTRFWASVVITALRDETGKVVGFAKVTRDLTARREAEEQSLRLIREKTAREVAEEGERRLRESEARYRALSSRLEIVLEGVADGITVQDRSGRIVFANAAAAKMCGFATGEELMSTPPAEIVARFAMLDAEGKPLAADDLPGRRVLAGHPPTSSLIHVREHMTGREWWVLLRANAVIDVEGQPELAVNIWHDVTAEHAEEVESRHLTQATAALGSSLAYEEMLSALAGVLVPGLGDWCSIYLLEAGELRQVAVVHADPSKAAAAEEYRQGYPTDREHAGGVWSVIQSGEARIFNAIDTDTLRRSTTAPGAYDALSALGMRSALLVPIRVRDRMLGAIALVSADAAHRYDAADVALTEEIGRRAGVALENAELYRAARSAASTAERAARVAEQASRAKDEFLAVVSHELRTPLNAIMGWSKLLTAREYDETKRRSALETIERNAVAMAQLIEDLLDMSRVISGKMRLEVSQVEVAQVVDAALDSIRPAAAARNIELSPVLEEPSPRVMGDATRIQQIVWNLLSNAVKFSAKGGRVDVVVRRVGSRAEIVVRDRGKGISPAFLPSVFDPFRQEDAGAARSKGGLGLGLAITRQLVELHGGRITAESEGEGCGSTFTVRIPLASVAHPDIQSRPAARHFDASQRFERPQHLRDLRILVVDDEEDSRRLVAEILTECGCVVTTAGSVSEAMAKLAEAPPDLLVSDIGMPSEDGYDLIRKVRELPRARGGDVPAAALTAYARAEDRQRLLNAGYSIHLAKPVEPAELVAVMATLSRFLHRTEL